LLYTRTVINLSALQQRNYETVVYYILRERFFDNKKNRRCRRTKML
jgi:hypothetical protein